MKLFAQNISADEVRGLKELKDSCALICINSTDGDLIPLKFDRNKSNILTLRFDDLCAT
jgi:hypothetical protein